MVDRPNPVSIPTCSKRGYKITRAIVYPYTFNKYMFRNNVITIYGRPGRTSNLSRLTSNFNTSNFRSGSQR